MSRAFTFDGRPQPLVTDFVTAEARAEALQRLYPENRYEVVPGGGAWRIAQQDKNGNFEEWVSS